MSTPRKALRRRSPAELVDELLGALEGELRHRLENEYGGQVPLESVRRTRALAAELLKKTRWKSGAATAGPEARAQASVGSSVPAVRAPPCSIDGSLPTDAVASSP